ncbi:MAG: asparagine--tRNA ligase [Aigarchaeota archaeon]|nr:asparagine--tRNA ligase [Aigarchaeota archaeon]MDW8093151.1 asparagine--tRNA ligase [Nitrososphaerota archaeon]
MRRPIEEVLQSPEGTEVEVWGWVRNVRRHGKLIFLDLRDASGIVQVAVKGGVAEDSALRVAESLRRESSVKVTGTVKLDERAPSGVEIRCKRIEVISLAEEDYPIRPKIGPKKLYDYRHLHLRSPKIASLMRIRSNLLEAFREFFRSRGFVEINCPSIITAAVEGGSTLFEVNYFGKKAYLTQSVQFYQEAAIFGLERVYSIQPSFRAEKSRTTRHLSEFWHIEAEISFADLNALMDVVEEMVNYVVNRTAETSYREIKSLNRSVRTEEVERPFPRIKYAEALEILERRGVRTYWGIDLGADEERVISTEFERPVFVTHFPKEVKAFYHKVDEEDPRVTLSADLLAPRGNGEIVGGGVRIDRYDQLIERIYQFGLDPKDYSWYLDLRRYGSVPHAGFGIGVERVLKWILDLPHVRTACLFPRTPTRVTP